MKPFIKSLTLLTLLCAAVMVLLGLWQAELIVPYSWYLLGYFFVITLLTYYMVYQSNKEPLDFPNYTLGATAIRLLISAVILGVFFWQVKDKAARWHFTITFFVMYFLFTAFEIKSLMANLRQNSGKTDKKDA
ncbi:hypothetical protein [Rhodoflexus caldus]|uniref:hypothetical protein n=1 Tax=Rhodoflexus caldus TaxID=2891236 RepID=UPI00202AA604|nr:hypothetical protein [Rhodoflexus caldus]